MFSLRCFYPNGEAEVFEYVERKLWLSGKLAFPDVITDESILVFRKVIVLHYPATSCSFGILAQCARRDL